MYHVPNVHQSKVLLLVASISHPLILCRESLQNDVLVALIVHRLSISSRKSRHPSRTKKKSSLSHQYSIGGKPSVTLYTYINRHVGTPHKNKTKTIVVHS